VEASTLSRSVPGCQHMANAADPFIPVAAGLSKRGPPPVP